MATKTDNPWKGLNFYVEGEILYGRNREIESLSQYILNNTQTVLYGKSGIGKSSVLNAGIFPVARACGLFPVGIRLDHQCDTGYMEQIRTAVTAAGVTVNEVVPVIDKDRETIWEYLHRNTFSGKDGKEVQLLLVLDQFEEIFTLQQDEKVKTRFFAELADLLNDVTPQYIVNAMTDTSEPAVKPAPVQVASLDDLDLDIDLDEDGGSGMPEYMQSPRYHIVFTLREDFLSYLERYTAYIPVMKANRFALQPINEEQAAEIIMKPRPGLVQEDVAALIIQKVTGRRDFLLDGIPEIDVDAAILSLYLSRLYEKMPEGGCITAGLVDQFSDDIIKDFYEDSVRDIPQATTDYLEDVLITNEGRRNNVSFSDLTAHGVDAGDIRKLADGFEGCEGRKLLRLFSYGGDIRVEYIHDILCGVVKNRREIRAQLREQEEEKQKLLAEEERKRKLLLENARRVRRQNRRRTAFFGAVIVSLLLIGAVTYFLKFHVYSGNFTRYDIRNGQVVGLPFFELRDAECKVTPLYYCLKHTGWLTHVSEIEVRSSNGKLPHSPRLKALEIGECAETDAKGTLFSGLLSEVTRVRINEDKNGRIIKEEYVDKDGTVLFELNYSYINDREAWVHFVSGRGQSLQVRDSGVEQAKLSWDDRGRLVGITYYDYNGVCQEIEPGVAGYLWVYAAGGFVCKYILNEYAQPTRQSGQAYNTVCSRAANDSVVTWYANSMSIGDSIQTLASDPARGPLGYVMSVSTGGREFLFDSRDGKAVAELVTTRDGRGNVLETRIEGRMDEGIPAIYKYEYDAGGILVSKSILTARGTPYGKTGDEIYRWKWAYDDADRLTLEERVNARNVTAYRRTVTRQQDVVTEEVRDITRSMPVVKRVDSIRGNTTVMSFFAAGDRKVNGKWFRNSGEQDSMLVFHKAVRTVDGNVTVSSYYAYDEGRDSIRPLETKTDAYGIVTSYFRKETVTDRNGIVSRYRICDAGGKIVKSMMYFIQNGQQIGRAVCGVDGTPVRCGNWEEEGFGYYKIYVNKNNDNNYANIRAVNEWEDNSVLYDGGDYWETEYLDCKGRSFIYNGKLYSISNSYSQMNFVTPKNLSGKYIPYLHILDKGSVLYRAGLRDGDRIVACGQWRSGMDTRMLEKEWKRAETEPCVIRVLRPDAGRGYTPLTADVDAVAAAGLDAEYHILALTYAEYGQLQQQTEKED